MIVAQGTLLALIGISVGLAAALVASRLLSSLLFGVKATDMAAYLFAIIPMFAAAMLASHLPARRAARVDPMVTIREER